MTRRRLADRFRPFGTTIFTEMTALAIRHNAVNLAQGFPDFDGPQELVEAAATAMRSGRNQYAPMRGVPELRAAIASDANERLGLAIDPEDGVCVTSGATEALHDAITALCDPGDEVVVLEPYYDSYRACCAVAGAAPRFVTLHAPEFRWREDELRAAFTPRTRVLLLNTPHNPTGRVLSRAELGLLAELCIEHDVVCVSDEVYDRLTYDADHVSPAALPGMAERTVVIGSTGKTFSMTGWKIGWALGPPDLVSAVATAHQFVTFSVATPLQHAMAAALTDSDDYVETVRSDYRQRRQFLVGALQEIGFAVEPPEGTYFALADIRPLGFDDDVDFCRRLATDVGVAAIPPTAFYENKERGRFLARFAFCKRLETLERAVARLSRLRT